MTDEVLADDQSDDEEEAHLHGERLLGVPIGELKIGNESASDLAVENGEGRGVRARERERESDGERAKEEVEIANYGVRLLQIGAFKYVTCSRHHCERIGSSRGNARERK